MLKFTYVTHPDQIKQLIEKFDSSKNTWIVSDLKSKIDIQNQCVLLNGYYTEDAILRVSDFWKLWLRRLSPYMQVVNDQFIKNLISQFSLTQLKDSNLSEHQKSTLYKYVKDLAPILMNDAHYDVFSEWASDLPEQNRKWVFLAKKCIDYLIQKEKIISSAWLAAYIQTLDLGKIEWNKKIIFDLSSEMTSIEFGIIQALAKNMDVEIIIPFPKWKDRYAYLLNTYEVNQGYAVEKQTLSQLAPELGLKLDSELGSELDSENLKPEQFLRFQTQAQEIKYIVSQVRSWLDQGIRLQQITLVSPSLEAYWPVLKVHLDQEGICYNKAVVTTLHTQKILQTLISRIKTYSKDPTWESLEQNTFYNYTDENKFTAVFEKFQALFFELIDDSDLKRDEAIKEMYYEKINFSSVVSREQFLVWIAKVSIDLVYNEDHVYLLNQAYKVFLAQTKDISMNISQWCEVFFDTIARKEITLKKENPLGIDIRSLQNTSLFATDHIIWFGLDESGFTGNLNHVLTVDQMDDLKFNFDFTFLYPEESHTEFNLRWLSLLKFKNQLFTCSKYSFKSEPLNTSVFVLEHQMEPDLKIDASYESRLDQVLKNYSLSNENIKESVATSKVQKMQVEKDLVLPESNPVNYFPQQISITDLVNYDQCAFKLLAGKGFKLRDYPTVALDLDPRQRGSLIHALFDYLTIDKKYKKFDRKAVENHLNTLRQQYNLFPFADSFWDSQLKKYLLLAEKFCEFENKRLASVAVEHSNEKDIELKLEKIKVTGRIDRYDTYNSNHIVVYDYKSSSSAINFGTNWLDKKEYQMLFYILALQEAFQKKSQANDLVGAVYFVFRDMSLTKGLLKESYDFVENLITKKSKKTFISPDDFELILSDFSEKLLEIEQSISQGSYLPVPFDVKICNDCQWRKICRAPHL